MKRGENARWRFQDDEPRFRVLVWRDSEYLAEREAKDGKLPAPSEIREFTTKDGAEAFAYLTEHPEGATHSIGPKGEKRRWVPAAIIQVGVLHWQTPEETQAWLKAHPYRHHPDPFGYGMGLDGPKLTRAKQDVEMRPYLSRKREDATPPPKPELDEGQVESSVDGE